MLASLLWSYTGDLRKERYLRLNGRTVYAKMVGRHMSQSRISTNVDDVVYRLNNAIYHAEVDDYEQHYQIDDTLILRCDLNDHSMYNFIGVRLNGKDYKRVGE